MHVHFGGEAAELAHAIHLDTGLPYSVTVHAVDEHDSAVPPDPRPFVETHGSFTAAPADRAVEFLVDASVLDVQPDWEARTPDGETRPIAEWSDHVAADITLSTSGRVVATATTPTVTGSWGALGESAG